MTNREKKRLDRLKTRADTLRLRLAAGTCTKLEDEKAELSALDWAIEKLTAIYGRPDLMPGGCQKCGYSSGGDWTQCGKVCPIAVSPHFNPEFTGRES